MVPPVILSMPNSAATRARYFQSHGVMLESPARSRSGIRSDDGVVVFGLPVARVRVDAWGCSCLLWSRKDALLDHVGTLETLRHCRLAMRQGVAEGFLLGTDDAPVERRQLLALRVAKAGAEYWAKWGCVTRAELARLPGRAQSARSQ